MEASSPLSAMQSSPLIAQKGKDAQKSRYTLTHSISTLSLAAPRRSLFTDTATVTSPAGYETANRKTWMRRKKELSRLRLNSPSTAPPSMDVGEIHKPRLPHFYRLDDENSIPRITPETLIQVLQGTYDEAYYDRKVIDCRFKYEYDGGHIDGAFNYNDKDILAKELLDQPSPNNTLLVFHCEYSVHRAPLMACHVRYLDRAKNIEHYPKLRYPEVYILEGGYSGFYKEFRDNCFPQSYVKMDDENHTHTRDREMDRIRQGKRRKFSRAKTYTFGECSGRMVVDSPTKAKQGPTLRLKWSPTKPF